MSYRKDADQRDLKLARILGAKVVANSGATKFSKGDILDPVGAPGLRFLYETKGTSKKTNPLTQAVMAKIAREAQERTCTPAGIVDFENAPIGVPETWVMIPLHAFLELAGRVEHEPD